MSFKASLRSLLNKRPRSVHADPATLQAAQEEGGGARANINADEGGRLYVLWRLALPLLMGLALGWFGAVCLGVLLDRIGSEALWRQGALGTAAGRQAAAGAGMEEFLTANPFRVSPMKPPAVAEETKVEDAPVITGSLAAAVLRGTLPQVGAWLEDRGQLRLVLVNTSFDVYTLESVTYREAVFVKGDERVTRELLYGPQTVARAPVGAPSSSSGGRASNVPMGNVVAATEKQDGQISAAIIGELVQNPFDELKKVRLRPKDGEAGLQIQWIQNDSILKQLGVQKGDVIKAINGIPFTNMGDIANSINSLMNSERFDVEVDRGGKATALRYVVH